MSAFTPGALLPVLAGILLARRLATPHARGWWTVLPIAVGVCLGAASVVSWTLLLLPLRSPRALVVADALVWIAVVSALLWRRPDAREVTDPSIDAGAKPSLRLATWLAAVLCLALLALAMAAFAATSATSPHGSWDAWSLWNLRARFVSLGYPDGWSATPQVLAHADYPLLVPLAVARAWLFMGSDAIAVPIIFAVMSASGIVLLAGAGVGRRCGAPLGWLTAAAILATPVFVQWAPSQFADIPLAFFFLATFVAVDLAAEAGAPHRWWMIVGACAGFAAWTKNEGQVFALFVFAAGGVWLFRSRGRAAIPILRSMLLGAAPAAFAIASFKVLFPATSDLAVESMARLNARLRNSTRWRGVWSAIGRQLWLGGAQYFGTLPIVAAVALVLTPRRPWPPAAALALVVVAGMLLAYAVSYMVSPHNLEWHLRTSVDRVVLQITPTAIWALMMLAGSTRTRGVTG